MCSNAHKYGVSLYQIARTNSYVSLVAINKPNNNNNNNNTNNNNILHAIPIFLF